MKTTNIIGAVLVAAVYAPFIFLLFWLQTYDYWYPGVNERLREMEAEQHSKILLLNEMWLRCVNRGNSPSYCTEKYRFEKYPHGD